MALSVLPALVRSVRAAVLVQLLFGGGRGFAPLHPGVRRARVPTTIAHRRMMLLPRTTANAPPLGGPLAATIEDRETTTTGGAASGAAATGHSVEQHAVPPQRRFRNYYDYRRTNDGVLEEGDEVVVPSNDEYVEVKGDRPNATTTTSLGPAVVVEHRVAGLSAATGASGAAAPGENTAAAPMVSSSSSGPPSVVPKPPAAPAKPRRRTDGQSHYQSLHSDELKHGVRSHLREIQGLGSELESRHEEELLSGVKGFGGFGGGFSHATSLASQHAHHRAAGGGGHFLSQQQHAAPQPGHTARLSAVHATRLTSTREWLDLEAHAREIKPTHLRTLLADARRVEQLGLEEPATGAFLDWSRHKVTAETMRLLFALARRMGVEAKMDSMRRGRAINTSERRAVAHFALRADPDDARRPGGYLGDSGRSGAANEESAAEKADLLYHRDLEGCVDMAECVDKAAAVRERIWTFAQGVRDGSIRAADGSAFETVVVVGIGGSYLGPEFVVQALDDDDNTNNKRTDGESSSTQGDLDVRFVANVDPATFEAETRGLDPKKCLVVVVSKSFSTAETMRNARRAKRWVLDAYGASESADAAGDSETRRIVSAHFAACAGRGAVRKVEEFGIAAADRLFEFWSWVGGRYSSCASAGLVPLAVGRGPDKAKAFLAGARAVDDHFFSAPLEQNLPVVMALLGVWNVNFLGLGARAVVPYAHRLSRFAAHVQQLEMESNGKSVTTDGRPLDYTTGEIVFGEPGTNAQHSFFQLLHMGQCVPCDFIGFLAPDADASWDDHDELVANLLAQPDALAVGRTFEDVVNDVLVGDLDDVDLCPHKTLSGDRPSSTLLFPGRLDARAVGALLALYEHRTAVQGFVWNINSWDQFGVELGKHLATDIRKIISDARDKPVPTNPSTARLLHRYVGPHNARHRALATSSSLPREDEAAAAAPGMRVPSVGAHNASVPAL